MYRADHTRESTKSPIRHCLTRHSRPSTMARVLNLLLALLLLGQTTTASNAPKASAEAEMRVYIVTMGPGDEAYEKFGHNMLRIVDPSRASDDPWHDVAYNWGVFEFDDQFIWNFVQGRLWYWMEPVRAQPAINFYENELNRTVWMQELNLSAAQKTALSDFCQWNSLEDNKHYKYDYFRDNCSTRVRDALDKATGGQLKPQATAMPSDRTYRSETLRLTADSWWLYVALDYVLGHPTDRKLTAWDEMFIPMRMRDRLNQLKILDQNGHEIPLVKSEQLLHTSSRAPLRARQPNWVGCFLVVGIAMGTLLVACAIAIVKTRNVAVAQTKWKRITSISLFLLFAIVWSILSAFAGGFLTYAWLLTDHSAARPNENLLQLGPWMLPMIVLTPLALRDQWKRARKAAFAIACLAAGLSLLGLLVKVLPMMYQSNWNMIALALPANAGLALGLWKLSEERKPKGTA
jgi:hypothetical protein